MSRTNQTGCPAPFMIRPAAKGLSADAMTIEPKGPDPNIGVRNALMHLKHAEAELLAVVRTGSHLKNGLLLEAHAFLWEAISTLNKAASDPNQT